MRAKYAKAIRFGIEKAREVKFWPESERNYYEKRSEVLYFDFEYGLDSTVRSITEEAFNRTYHARRQQYTYPLDDTGLELIKAAEKLEYVKWTETRQERYLRELNEKVQRLEAVVNDLKESSY